MLRFVRRTNLSRRFPGRPMAGSRLLSDYRKRYEAECSRVEQAILCVLSRRRRAASSVNATRPWNRSAHTLIGGARHFRCSARNVKIVNFSVIRLNERWILFFELTRAGTAEIGYADAKELPGQWIMRNALASTIGQPMGVLCL